MVLFMIDIISATRFTERHFWNRTALGISLKRLRKDDRLVPKITFENRTGLPEIYNLRIHAEDSGDTFVFIHDDVWIDDDSFADAVIEGLKSYDVIGVAGNRRRLFHQPSWAFIDTEWTWDDSRYLSGAVAHGQTPPGEMSIFGPAPAGCELLDGVLLAANKSSLIQNDVTFDTRFKFHFYDMDFCRTARLKGLHLGTWPISLTHQSDGVFGSPQWHENYQIYLEKWND